MKLELRNVHKAFGSNHVLNGIDLEVDDGDVVCLIGPSGCGKSTLLRCINLLEQPNSGEIIFDGVDITASGVNTNSVRKRIGIVFQSFNLFPHLNTLDNVTLGLRKAHGLSKQEADAKALPLLASLGLEEKAADYPDRLSGGQQQRAAIARALVSDPEILLLDEITSALDPELVGEVLATIRGLAAGGMTMILATHEMGFARDVADKICFLHEGVVLEASHPSVLLSTPTHPRTRQFLDRVIEAGRL